MQGEKLIAGLAGLQRAGRRLTRRNQIFHGGAGAVDIADDTGLHLERILKGADAVFPARIGIGDHLRVAAGKRRSLVTIGERLVDLLHIIGDSLGFAEQPLRLANLILQGLKRAEWQRSEIAGLVDEAGRLVLDLPDLIVDLFERPGGGQQVLRVIGRIIDDPAKLCVSRAHKGKANDARGGKNTGHKGRAHIGQLHVSISISGVRERGVSETEALGSNSTAQAQPR